MRSFTLTSLARTVFSIVAMGGLVCFGTPRAAQACGGTFCDTGPTAMPVDQTGENIIFVMKPGQVEAHIQIQYKGDAARFSWVLPVQALPEIEVGSQALFDRVLNATVPRFGFLTQRDFCGTTTGGGGFGGTGPGSADASAPRDGGGVVISQKQVGAFETTVLSGGTGGEVVDWLTANGYQTPSNAPALIQDYVNRGHLFVAVKLTGGAGIDEIHPLVVRYTGTEPCVPLKLTAVAAVEDMGVRTFFLGTRRVVPKNFKHMVPNPVRLDWLALGTNYKELVSRAADSFVADGKAFLTEYAGPTAVVGSTPVAPSQWDATAFSSVAVVDVVDRLSQQGFLTCFGSTCTYRHPLLLPLLREFVPPPSSLTTSADGGTVVTDPRLIEGYFYSCLSCYADKIDMAKWNAAEFASTLAERIVNPARHADTLLATWPYLTRMFTTLSPAEMTQDPEFIERDGLADVSISGTAARRITCTGASGMTLPDGRMVALTPTSSWPGFGVDMPWVERIEEFGPSGDPIVLVDNSERINALLKAWNDSQNWPPSGGSGGNGGSGGATGADAGFGSDGGGGTRTGTGGAAAGGATGTGAGGATGTGAGGATGTGASGAGAMGTGTGGAGSQDAGSGPSGGAAGSSGAGDGSDPRGGCGCEVAARRSLQLHPWGLAALVGLVAARRRRRR